MKICSQKTFCEVTSGLFVNLASGYVGLMIISPGFFEVSFQTYLKTLTQNLPFAILGLITALILFERSKKL